MAGELGIAGLDPTDAEELTCDVLVIGGGTAGTMAALTAAEHGADASPQLRTGGPGSGGQSCSNRSKACSMRGERSSPSTTQS
nr:FAD-binding protein [Streptomyces canus]